MIALPPWYLYNAIMSYGRFGVLLKTIVLNSGKIQNNTILKANIVKLEVQGHMGPSF